MEFLRILICCDRTGEAIIQLFRKARCKSVKFEGIVKSIKSKEPTGSPKEEQIKHVALDL